MQLPQRRRRQVKRSLARTATLLTLNAGALLTTALLVRLALAIVGGRDQSHFAGIAMRVTDPLVWPLGRLPAFDIAVAGSLTPADLVALALAALVPLMVTGVIAGWEAEGRR